MVKPFLLLLVSLGTVSFVSAQRYMTRNGFIGFYSKTLMEDIAAENTQVYAVIDAGAKNMAFTLLMKGFIFRKELMQEHFNENYVESDKYPKASFTGSFTGDLDLRKNGTYPVTVTGDLSIHHITRTITCPGTLEMTDGAMHGTATFSIRPEDYDIKIPSIVRDKISPMITIRVTVDCNPVK